MKLEIEILGWSFSPANSKSSQVSLKISQEVGHLIIAQIKREISKNMSGIFKDWSDKKVQVVI
jgi:hypothetical protein